MIAHGRRRSAPVAKADYDSDENQVEVLDYREDVYYGWDDEAQAPAPVQVKRPDPLQRFKRPGDKLHAAVWRDDPTKVQKLVLQRGT